MNLRKHLLEKLCNGEVVTLKLSQSCRRHIRFCVVQLGKVRIYVFMRLGRTSVWPEVTLRQRYDETGKTDIPEDARHLCAVHDAVESLSWFKCFRTSTCLSGPQRKALLLWRFGLCSNPSKGENELEICPKANYFREALLWSDWSGPKRSHRKSFGVGSANRSLALQRSFAWTGLLIESSQLKKSLFGKLDTDRGLSLRASELVAVVYNPCCMFGFPGMWSSAGGWVLRMRGSGSAANYKRSFRPLQSRRRHPARKMSRWREETIPQQHPYYGCGSKPKVPFSGWLPPHCSLLKGVLGVHRGTRTLVLTHSQTWPVHRPCKSKLQK